MWSTALPVTPDTSNSDFLRRYARRLLRNVHSSHTSRALPVLRRVLAAQVTPEQKLTALYAARDTLRLKHVLHTLARELGFANWEACKREINQCPPEMLDRYRVDLGAFGDFEQNWFRDEATAREWQQENGGYVVNYAGQAVAILRR